MNQRFHEFDTDDGPVTLDLNKVVSFQKDKNECNIHYAGWFISVKSTYEEFKKIMDSNKVTLSDIPPPPDGPIYSDGEPIPVVEIEYEFPEGVYQLEGIKQEHARWEFKGEKD